MNRFFREIDLLIYDGTQMWLTEAEREEKRKAAHEKASEFDKAFTGTYIGLQRKKQFVVTYTYAKTMQFWVNKLHGEPTQKRSRAREQLEKLSMATLAFLRHHFSEYFTVFEHMPRCLWEPCQTELEQQSKNFFTQYPELKESGLIDTLQEILLEQNDTYKK